MWTFGVISGGSESYTGSRTGSQKLKYDILLKGGTVIDAAQGLNAVRDVAIVGGVIAAIEADIPESTATQTVSVKGKYVTPGLVDIHTHVYYGVTTWGIRPDAVCPTAGTTTVVDAGSPSWVTFPGFREFIVEPRTDAYPHLYPYFRYWTCLWTGRRNV